jgi:hypothetical protein
MLEFIKSLDESRLIGTGSYLRKYSSRDLLDITFLHIIAIQILKSEFDFQDIVRRYVGRTLTTDGTFQRSNYNGTDLYMLLNAIENAKMHDLLKDGNKDTRLVDSVNINLNDIRTYLSYCRNGKINSSYDRQVLMKFEKQMMISDTSYRAIRRLSDHWIDLNKTDRQMVMTRLLQAFRARCPQAELKTYLETLAAQEKLEIQGAANAETGSPGAESTMKEPLSGPSKAGFLKKLAYGAAGVAAGAMVGMAVGGAFKSTFGQGKE